MSDNETRVVGERRDTMRAIEQKHFGTCWEQVWTGGRRLLIELMELKGTNQRAVVIKQFEKSVPPASSSKPWPELAGAWVYVPVDGYSNTWTELDDKLTAFREANKAG